MSSSALGISAQVCASLDIPCSNCGSADLQAFYSVKGVPVHSVLLMNTREIAMSYPKGDISLALCSHCGFIANTSFDPSVHSYSDDYEETQGYSKVFQQFHRQLALSLIDKYQLRGKHIIEIGCGKGEFLALLCELGGNTGIGFDPAFVAARNPIKDRQDVQFIADFYSEKYVQHQSDFICCKMTLEHIPDTRQFVSTVRRSIGTHLDCTVFFMIPNMTRVLEDLAFWDVYYEHCSYFTQESLTFLFADCGFEVLATSIEYADQYLTIAARPAKHTGSRPASNQHSITAIADLANQFSEDCSKLISRWNQSLADFSKAGKRVVVWGSGSKGVAFLTAVSNSKAVEYVVDINPHRQNKFMAGTGQQIVGPGFLYSYKPDIVIVMNPAYRDEVQAELDRMNLDSLLVSV